MSSSTKLYSTGIGPFFQASAVVALETDQDFSLGGALSAGRVTFPKQATVTGFVREQASAITAGSLTIAVLKNGVSAGTVVLTSGTRGSSLLSSVIAFATGDSISFQYTTNLTYVGPTNVIVFPVFSIV